MNKSDKKKLGAKGDLPFLVKNTQKTKENIQKANTLFVTNKDAMKNVRSALPINFIFTKGLNKHNRKALYPTVKTDKINRIYISIGTL